MNIIILGAGQVGGTLAENLVHEDHSITVVDHDQERLQDLQNRIDVRTIVGHASYPNVLRSAGAEDADMLIAVVSNDETNLVACQIAYTLFQTPTKIARIRSPHYLEYQALLGREGLPVDVFISPEQLVTNYVCRLIEYPGALQVLDFAEGRVRLVAIRPYFGGPLVGKHLGAIREHMPELHGRVAAIYRSNRSIPLTDNTVIEIGDEVFFIAASSHIREIMASLRRLDNPYKRIMIAGGGNIGLRLARSLERHFQVKIIEQNKQRTQVLADELSNSIVLQGDSSDRELLLNENIEYADVFVAVTNDDEANIMSCMQAKRLGVRQAMALITRPAYVDLIEGSDIDIAISPQQATIGTILTYVRRGDIVKVHSLRRGAAEAIEVVAHGNENTSKVIGRTIADIKMPKDTVIGALVRNEQVIMPQQETVIEAEDHIILFLVDKKQITDVEKLFHVSATFV